MAKKNTRGKGAEISATEAARNFSELLNRVRYQGRSYLVERGGEAVCEIRPVYHPGGFTGADLARLLAAIPDAPREYLEAVQKVIDQQPAAEDRTWPR